MELVPAGIELSFDVTFNADDLNVGMLVYDTTSVSPVLISGPTAMSLVAINTYVGKFTPVQNKAYVIIKAVYTDDTLMVVDTDFSQGSEAIFAQVIGGGGSGPSSDSVIGYVISDETLVGVVNC